ATASIAFSSSKTSVSGSLGLAIAQNRIDKDIAASIVNVPSVITDGDVTVSATDDSSIEATSLAAAISLALSQGTGTLSVTSGSSGATNIVLSRTNAFINNSAIGTDGEKAGNVAVEATANARIHAAITGVAAGGL